MEISPPVPLALLTPAEPPPSAPKHPLVTTVHGETRTDDYAWLRDKENPDVRAYLEGENRYADAVMANTKDLRETLYKELLGRIKETDLSVPYPDRGYLYFSRTEEGKQYPIYCRRVLEPSGPEETILDLNVLAEGRPFMALGGFAVSDSGRLLAYTTDETGFRQYRLFVKDLETGALLSESLDRATSLAWAADSVHLFVTVENDAKRPYRLLRLGLGTAEEDLLYEEEDERFSVNVGRTRSRRFLVLSSGSHTTAEARVLEASDPTGQWTLIAPRRAEHEYDVDHRGETFYIRTNDRGRNFRLVTAPVSSPGEAHWAEFVAHRDDVMLEGIDLFSSHAVLFERHDGLPRLRAFDFASESYETLEFPEPVYSVWPGTNAEWGATAYRYTYESFLTPVSVFDYDLKARTHTLLKRTEVLGGYDPTLYTSGRVHATAADGTRIPISYVFRKDTPGEGGRPTHLYGYGSYGISIPAGFSSNRVSLLDRGVLFAIAHIRGGGELGKAWHDGGRMAQKINTFTDFISCAEHLIATGMAARASLTMEGGSAGGLLMGAVLNMRPDLPRAVVMKVPFVDVINTMLDASLPLTVGEYEEWGNPGKKAEYDVIRRYCPYSNLRETSYPAILVKTSFNDSQVMYWEPAKYVARLRTLKRDKNPLLLKTNMAAGHGGSSGRYDFLREVAFDYSFLLTELGLAR
jgi:oligopeptidase B